MTRWRSFIFPALLLIYLALAITSSLTIPLGEAADEVSHYSYISSLIAQHQLPTSGGALGEAHQPPLYYALVAVLTGWLPGTPVPIQANPDFALDNPETPNLLLHPLGEAFPFSSGILAWHLMRFISIALGAITLWATFNLARETFPGEPLIAWGATAFAAFLPAFLFLSSVLNNDNLIITLSTLTLWQIVRILKRAPRAREGLLLGVLLGLAALTKLTGFLLWGVSGIVFLYLLRTRETRGAWIRVGLFALGSALILVTPWLAFSQIVYGDAFGWTRFLAVTARPDPTTFAYWATYVTRMDWSFWGKFGGASQLRMPDFFYFVLNLLFALALLGIVKAFFAKDGAKKAQAPRPLFALYGIFCFILVAAHLRLETMVEGTDQARQIFSGLAPFALAFVWALTRLTKRRGFVVAVLSGGMVALSFAAVCSVGITYASNAQTLEALPRLPVQHPPADFGNQIRVVDYQVASNKFVPGDRIAVRLYWQALTAPQEEDWLLLKLVDAKEDVATQEGVPTAGRVTTDRWQTNQIFVSEHFLTIPNDVAPGTFHLQLGLHPAGSWEWLAVRGREMLDLGEVIVEIP